MPASVPAIIEPELLQWARETSGYSLDEAAHKLGFKDPSKLADAEQGRSHLTIAKLREAARVYRRPLAAFFLPRSPEVEPLPRDFRRIAGAEPLDVSPPLLLALRQARRRREIATRLYSEVGHHPRVFNLQARLEEHPDVIAERAREWLGVGEDDDGGKIRTATLNDWIDRVEARDVLVFQASRVPVRTMRGCSISSDRLPVIVLNGADAPTARIFTLMHELVHLMLREDGVCGVVVSSRDTPGHDRDVEIFCNRVAGAILLPSDELLQDPSIASAQSDGTWDEGSISHVAHEHNVSREVVVIRLQELGLVSRRFVERKLDEYRAEYEDRNQGQTSKSSGGPSYSVLVVRNNGRRFTRLIMEALERNQISLREATDYLDVRAKHFPEMAERVGL
jgi:Zn-dependent peptidase ImmA (M78 family)/transcriptional regulator with XRE-family HTH domain